MERIAVDVVHWDMSRQLHGLDAMEGLLTPDEIERANRLVAPVHRRRFVLARGLLRRTLAAATGHDPAALRFTRGTDGKPSLIGEALEFNVSHSEDGLLIAMTRGAAVGCDLEPMRAMPQAAAIAGRWFSREERERLADLAGEALDRAFLSCWVRKEAVLKTLGTGLQAPMNFTAGVAPADGAEVCLTLEGRTCWLVDLVLSPGWIAAVASERPMKVSFPEPAKA